MIQLSIDFMHIEMRNAYLRFQKKALGKNVPAVATGSLYIDEYFKENDKKVALELVKNCCCNFKMYLKIV